MLKFSTREVDSEKIYMLSGISPYDEGGTAKALSKIQSRSSMLGIPIEIMMLKNKSPRNLSDLMKLFFRRKLVFFDKFKAIECKHLVIAHPQSLGYSHCLDILDGREFTWILALDSSFFCRASYNHYMKESSPCFRCLGDGLNFVEKYGCNDFPVMQDNDRNFQIALVGLAEMGKIGFLAQNNIQADIIRKHFGVGILIRVVGMEADFNLEIENNSKFEKKLIIFHANPLGAKGLGWTLELAKIMPDYKFLFPFDKSCLVGISTSLNMEFKPMTWNAGLKEAISEAEFVICPSLWSAPIEGALIKSIISGVKCLVVHNETAYPQEDPNMPVIKLPSNLEEAARAIRAIEVNFKHKDRNLWLEKYLENSKKFTSNIYDAVMNDA